MPTSSSSAPSAVSAGWCRAGHNARWENGRMVSGDRKPGQTRPLRKHPPRQAVSRRRNTHRRIEASLGTKNVDMVFLRENTESVRGDRRDSRPGRYSTGCRRHAHHYARHRTIIKLAFETAMQRNRAPKMVSAASLCGQKQRPRWLSPVQSIFDEVATQYPEVEKDVAIIDAFTQWLIVQPEHYDVVVTTNMFTDIVLPTFWEGWVWPWGATSVTTTRCSSQFMDRPHVRRARQAQPHSDDPRHQ